MEEHLARVHPRADGVSAGAHGRAIRAKALDALRGLLPAATLSNVGIFASGQAYEALLVRMRAHPLAEVRQYADWMLEELRQVIPAFLRRVDLPDRGARSSEYLAARRDETARIARELLRAAQPAPVAEVELTDFDPDGEIKVVAAALYAVSARPDRELIDAARRMSADERRRVLEAYVGERPNRRDRPGRAFERTSYRFDVLTDYGAFRDLQRHRMLTLEWQALSCDHGYGVAEAVEDAGGLPDFRDVMERAAELHDALVRDGLGPAAAYAVPMAYRVRFVMEMNAREAMHVIELRTAPQGHAAYRRVCQAMHRLIAERAGHRAIAAAMRFANHEAVELERIEAELRGERRREGGER
jgi:thymidylate synthase ThyX